MDCFILKSNRMLFVILVRDFLSARCKIQLNCCVMLQHPPEIEVLRICTGGLQTAGAGTELIRRAADLLGIDTLTKVKRICSAGMAETQ